LGRLDVIPPGLFEPDWEMLGIDPQILRSWQRQAVTQVWTELARTGEYRGGWVVSLGGGKTLAGLIVSRMVEKPAVLADRYLHETWRSEAKKFGFPCPLLSTYESAHKLPADVDGIIVDECLKLKNVEAQRTQHATRVAKQSCIVFAMTGIPTGGKGCVDFRWLRVVRHGCVPELETAWQFLFGKDTEPKQVGGNMAYVTTEWDEDAVARFVAPYVTVVDTSALLAHLPEVEYRYIELPKPAQFDQVVAGVATSRGTMKAVAQSRQITDGFVLNDDHVPMRLSPGTGQSKAQVIRSLIETMNEPVVVYSAWTEGVAIMAETLKGYNPSILSGETGGGAGDQITRFKNGGTNVLIANAAYSKGMNLQGRCRVLIFLSVSSRPDDYEQALGRIYRPGQKRGCIVIHVVCQDTLDRRSIELVQKHKSQSEAFIDKLLAEEFEKLRGTGAKRSKDKNS